MKKEKIIVLILLLISFVIEANEQNIKSEKEFSLEIIGLKQTPYDYIFRLKQKSIYPKVNLDCQSFFNGLHFLSKEEKIIDRINLDHHECEQLFLLIKTKEEKYICHNIYLEEDDFSLKRSGSNCL